MTDIHGEGTALRGATATVAPLLSVRDMTVVTRGSQVPIVSDFNLDIAPGETVGIVGESGCGKTTAVLGMLGLLDPRQLAISGSARYGDTDLIAAPDTVRRQIWGRDVGIIYQDALRALNPVMTVGQQIAEVFEAHGGRPDAKEEVVNLLARVGIASPEVRQHSYPHELSGGMRQRVMAAIAVAMRPRLLVADEPTTALDVTIQAQVLELIRGLVAEMNMATVLISHDLGVIAGMCDRVVVLYAGRIVEQGDAAAVFEAPRHPYTRALLRATPGYVGKVAGRFNFIPGTPPAPSAARVGCAFRERCSEATDACTARTPELVEIGAGIEVACFHPIDPARTEDRGPAKGSARAGSGVVTVIERGPAQPTEEPQATPILEARNVTRVYGRRSWLRRSAAVALAVDGVTLTVRAGECVGLVGESGSGKSTLGRLLVGMEDPTSGEIVFDGRPVSRMSGAERRAFRRSAQMIYQDPRSSLNRSYSVGSILRTALRAGGADSSDVDAQVADVLERVGLSARYAERYPMSLSGGECQRVAIARALCVRPKVLVADEAISSLDVSVQGQILNLLADIQRDTGIGIVFIAHDLGVVRELCDTAAVMYLGRIVEQGPAKDVLSVPQHPYSMALKSAAPIPDPRRERSRRRIILLGDPPSALAPPKGCAFHTRCPVGPLNHPDRTACIDDRPDLRSPDGAGHAVACHYVGSDANTALLGQVT